MVNTRQAKANSGNRIAFGVFIIIVSLFFFLCNVRAFGGVGRMVYGFSVGFFGLASYAYSVMGIIFGVAMTFGFLVKRRPAKILMYFGLLILGIFALHIYTSSGHIIGASYGTYLANCYNNTNTAGGLLFGLVAYPLMKVLTSVGALIVATLAFLTLGVFALIPSIRRESVYSATSKAERERKSKRTRRERAPKKEERVERQETSSTVAAANGLFVVPRADDPMTSGTRRARGGYGAEGYTPMNAFDPLYPNKGGAYQDEQSAVATYPNTTKYVPLEQAKEQVARELLFGENYGEESYNKYKDLRDSGKIQPLSGNSSYNSIKKRELDEKLNVGGEQMRSEFIMKHRAEEQQKAPENKPEERPIDEFLRSQNEYLKNGKLDFEAIKRDSLKEFGSAEYMNESGRTELKDVAHSEPREVVRPTKHTVNPTVTRAQEAVGATSGMLGAVNRANDPREQGDIESVAYTKPTQPTSTVVRVNNMPQGAARNARPQSAPHNARPSQNIGNAPQNVQNVQARPAQNAQNMQARPAQNAQNMQTRVPNNVQNAPQNMQTRAPQNAQNVQGGQGALYGQNVAGQNARNLPPTAGQNAQNIPPVAGRGVGVRPQPVRKEEPTGGIYNPVYGAPKMPKAFSGNSIDRPENARPQASANSQNAGAYGAPQNAGSAIKRPENPVNAQFAQPAEHKPAQGWQQEDAKPVRRPRFNAPKIEEPEDDALAPSEPLPEKREVTGKSMSRVEIQQATDIKHLSGKDKETAEMQAQIENIKKAMNEAPPISAKEKEAILREQKQKAASKRGLSVGEEVDFNQMRIEQAIEEASRPAPKPKRPYSYPPLDLLTPPAPAVEQNEDYEIKKEKLLDTLKLFNIGGEVIDIIVGPAFTMYKLRVEMPRGKTINYFASLENDIAMKMEVDSVTIVAPIPGENAVGVEVPNKVRRTVNLSEIIDSKEFNSATDPVTFALGKNLYGESKVARVAKLPHLLIAGATGAGKSCCINSLIISLLYKASPDELKLILIDPKKVELLVYEGLPHLLMDEIIYEMDKAIRALNWTMKEMQRRIDFLSDMGYRDIDEYNREAPSRGFEKMPRIVVIVDEFAELMSLGKKAVEDAINRLARLSRATGMHLVLATQRPSIDVISGTIKNNFPSRIAFKVTQSFDSKTILDCVGAEKLLGDGDMYYKANGAMSNQRIQGAFISNSDVQKVVDYIKSHNDSEYDASIKDEIMRDEEEAQDSEKPAQKGKSEDALPPELFDALELGIEMREQHDRAFSISYMQRKLGLGFQKAARIHDLIKTLGYLSQEGDDKKKAYVNISREELEELKNGGTEE